MAEDKHQNLHNLLQPRDANETKQLYTEWADKYEEDIKDIEYNGAKIVVSCFLELNIDKDSRILDIGAGTGIIGHLLEKHGYTNIDGLDACPKMLELAKQKNCYKNLMNSVVSPDSKLPIEDNYYDVIIMAGVLCPGHIRIDAFSEIIRIAKSGGTICWAMASTQLYEDRDEQFRDGNFERIIVSLCDKLKWISVLGYPKPVHNYLEGNNGWFYAMQVI